MFCFVLFFFARIRGNKALTRGLDLLLDTVLASPKASRATLALSTLIWELFGLVLEVGHVSANELHALGLSRSALATMPNK